MADLPLPPGLPVVRVRGRPLSPQLSALVLGNVSLIEALLEGHVPPLTAADLMGVAFVDAFRGLPGRPDVDRLSDAAEIVLALYPRTVCVAGWPQHRVDAASIAMDWLIGSSADEALSRAARAYAEPLRMFPDADSWRRTAWETTTAAFDEAARSLARRRRWQMTDVYAALALGDLPVWRDAHGYLRVAALKAREAERLPDPDGTRTEALGRKAGSVERLAARGTDQASVAAGSTDRASDPISALYLRELRAKLERLAPRQHELIALLADGYSQAEAAERLGIKESTVGVMVWRLKKILC